MSNLSEEKKKSYSSSPSAERSMSGLNERKNSGVLKNLKKKKKKKNGRRRKKQRAKGGKKERRKEGKKELAQFFVETLTMHGRVFETPPLHLILMIQTVPVFHGAVSWCSFMERVIVQLPRRERKKREK